MLVIFTNDVLIILILYFNTLGVSFGFFLFFFSFFIFKYDNTRCFSITDVVVFPNPLSTLFSTKGEKQTHKGKQRKSKR